MSVDTSQLEAYLALLQTADARIDRDVARELKKAVDNDFIPLAQGLAHKQSGFMAASIHQLGPFAPGGGILESQISSAASYVENEIGKGGDHDWAQRTVDNATSPLDQLATRVGLIVATKIAGGA